MRSQARLHGVNRIPTLLTCGFATAIVLSAAHCGGDSSPLTDEELIERFVVDVTGVVDGPMMTRSLRYVELGEVPLDVSVPQYQGVYRPGGEEDLTKRYRTTMRREFGGSELKVRSRTITVEGTTAKVMMRLKTARGPIRVRAELRKIATGWKVSLVHAEPGL